MTFSPSQLQSSDFRFCIQKVRHGWILMWKQNSFGLRAFLEHCLVEESLKSKCCRFSNLHWGILTQHLSMQPSPLQIRWNSGHSCMDFLGGVKMLLINNAHIPEMNLPVPHHGNSKLQEWKTQPTQRLGCTKALWSSMQQRNQWNCELVSRKSQHRNPSITVCSHQRPHFDATVHFIFGLQLPIGVFYVILSYLCFLLCHMSCFGLVLLFCKPSILYSFVTEFFVVSFFVKPFWTSPVIA